jgi:hypothetical protein
MLDRQLVPAVIRLRLTNEPPCVPPTFARTFSDNSVSATPPPVGSAAMDRLLPGGHPPEAVVLFLEERQSTDTAVDGMRQRQFHAATAWVLDALCHAHEHLSIKTAARRLLATQLFTANLDASGDVAFTKTLRPGLHSRLTELGQHLAADYAASNLGAALSAAAVTAAVGDPNDHPLAVGLDRSVTQIDLLPCDPTREIVDFAEPWRFPEDVYAHALLMTAAGLDAAFQRKVARLVGEHNTVWTAVGSGAGTATHGAAPPKAAARVKTKAAADYRDRDPPVSANNVDVVRCLVTADTPTELLAVGRRLAQAFTGGVVRLKNLFAASVAERTERFHLLPLMLTVVVDGDGDDGADHTAFRQLLIDPHTSVPVGAYATVRDPGVPPSRWALTTAAARAMLASESVGSRPAQILGELQLVLTRHAVVRHQMHEVGPKPAHRCRSFPLWFGRVFCRLCPLRP